ncbi:MAG TPA: hypothetical protein VNV42_04465 [Solirubrobacteraceae bacterium]|nr:hypothetical protein [Solirubrobacteraceae bacterium]
MLVALLMMLTLGGVAAAAAHAEEAPYWAIEGASLAKERTHNITAKATKGFELAAGTDKISCGSLKLSEGTLVGSNAGEPGTIKEVVELESCTLTGNGTKCKVKEPIVSNHLKPELVYNVESKKERGKKPLLFIKPETGGTLATIHFEAETGGTCTQLETKLTGFPVGEIETDPGEEHVEVGEAKTWLVNFPKTPIEEVWLIKGGKGSRVIIEEAERPEAFGSPATLQWQTSISLANEKHEAEETKWGFQILPRIKSGEFVNSAGNALGKNLFKGESLLTAVFEQQGGTIMTCSGATWIGTISSKTAGVLTEALIGCVTGGKLCNTTGKGAGIVTLGLTLNVVNESSVAETKELDYLLIKTPETDIFCEGGTEIKVRGDYLTPVATEQKLQESYTYTAKGKGAGTGEQEPELSKAQTTAKVPHFEMSVGGGGFANAGVTVEQVHTKYEEQAKYI